MQRWRFFCYKEYIAEVEFGIETDTLDITGEILKKNEKQVNKEDLIKVMKEFNVKGALVCESPNIEDDCKLLKDYYFSI